MVALFAKRDLEVITCATSVGQSIEIRVKVRQVGKTAVITIPLDVRRVFKAVVGEYVQIDAIDADNLHVSRVTSWVYVLPRCVGTYWYQPTPEFPPVSVEIHIHTRDKCWLQDGDRPPTFGRWSEYPMRSPNSFAAWKD